MAGRLPSYMVPSAVVVLDAFPLTPNNKIDRAALPAPLFTPVAGRAPRNEPETALCEVAAEILHLESRGAVSIDDNFFDLGGDSILSIQLVSRARRRGVDVTPRQVFEAPTFAALAALAGTLPSSAAHPIETAADRIGPVPTTPMVAWLRHVGDIEGGRIEAYNQSEIFQVPAGASLETVTGVVQALLDRHEMLRARLVRTPDSWTLDIPAAPPPAAEVLRRVAVEGDDDETLLVTLEGEGEAAARRLDPDRGVMLQAVWFDLGAERAGRLLLVIHHLAVDIVSWSVIGDDLADLGRGERPAPPSTSFRTYARRLVDRLDQPGVQDEAGYWEQTLVDPGPVIGRRPLDPAVDVGRSTETVSITLDPADTHPLLTSVPAAFHATVTDVLLTGLALALARWQGQPACVVDLERHGRDLDDVDLTRTVGWHTATHPARLDLTGIDIDAALAGRPAAGAALKAVKEQLRAIPAGGAHYGLLRWLDPAGAARLAPTADRPGPQVAFNYAGRRDWDDGDEPGDWEPAGDDADITAGTEAMPVTHVLDINAEASDGPEGPELGISWTYPTGMLDRAAVETLAALYAEALRALAAHAATPGAGGASPSDFPLVRLTQADLDDLERRIGPPADVVPVTPLQEGFFFHAQLEEGHDPYLPQTIFDLGDGAHPVDGAVLRRSVEALLDRHPNLRAGFAQLASGIVVSVVPREAPLPWREIHLAGLTEEEQTEAVTRLAEEDLAAGFDLGRPPLIRLTLAHLGAGRARLVITSHHVLMDGWSLPIFYEELAATYDAGGDTAGLEPARPFRDYLAWLAGQDPDTGLAAWREALAGLEGPTLVAPGQAPGEVPRAVEAELPAADTAALAEVARRRHLTLNSVIQAAWAAVVGIETGRDDVVFGATVAGRPAELDGVESMVGLFINTVPVRARLHPAESLLAVAERIQADQTRLLGHHHLRLSTIVRAAAGVDELFDTLVAFENFPDLDDPQDPVTDGSGGGLTLDEVEGRDVTHYPLHLSVSPGPTLAFELKYRADHWTETAARSLLERVTRLLISAITDGDAPLAGLDPLSAAERRRALVDWNPTGPAVPEVTFPAVFEAHAAATPDAAALVLDGEQLTYRQLNERANRLARLLVAAGAGPETVVAVALPRSIDLITALVAVMKSGAAYLPLDLDYPADRLRFMLDDAAPVAVITTTALAATVGSGSGAAGPDTVLLDDGATVARLAGLPPGDLGDADRRAPLLPAHPAYVIYTSGTTGRPKGVVVPHAGMAKLLEAQRRLGVTSATRGLQFTSPSFDVSFWELVRAFGHGGCLVVVPADRRLPGPELIDYIAAHGVTDLDLPPSVLAALPADVELPAGLTLVTGGEAVPPEVVTRFAPGRRMFDAYGPTEATVYSTIWECPPDHSGPVLIGRPAPLTTAYVLDHALRLCPPGATGELYVGGAGLARGYHRQPGLTATRFVADPYGPPGARLYRTGDRARWTAEGTIEFLGRVDDQVKVRGFRIEPGEVEAALEAHPEVGKAVVVARDDDGVRRLVGYVTAAGRRPEAAGLRTFVAGRLPSYMVPAAIVVLDAFPVTPNGKVDRAALPAPAFEAGAGRDPRDDREATLCRLFAEVLGVDGVTIDDNFFDLGGDSILSIQLVSRARRAGLAISPRQVFESGTVAELVAAAGDTPAGFITETAADRFGPVPATPIMNWLRHVAEVQGGRIETFHQSQLFQVPAGVAERQLEAVLDGLLRRHEVLRARLLRRPDSWSLDIPAAPATDVDVLRRVDVTAAALADIEAEAEAAAGRLDPDGGVMVQAVWFDLGSDRPGRLLLVIHHLVVDIVSWSVIGDDLAELAGGGEPGPPTTSFRTYARRLVDHAAALDVAAELPFWEDVLSRPNPVIGRRALDPAVDVGSTTDTLSVTLPADVTGPLLTRVPAAFHAGADDVLLAGLALATGAWRRRAGHDEPAACLVALERHGRDADALAGLDLTGTVGWFTAIHPVRLDLTGVDVDAALAGGPAAGAALGAVKEQLRTLPGGGFHYGLLRWLDPSGSARLGALPGPQILFNYGGRSDRTTPSDWDVAADDVDLGDGSDAMPVGHVLEINAEATDSGAGLELEVTWNWPTGVLDRSDVEALAGLYLQALRGLVVHAATPGAGAVSPTDFPLVELTRADLDDLEARVGPLADVLPATPLQEGFFFHSRLEDGHDPYLPQVIFDLGPVDPEVLRRSLEAVLDRHPNLRAGFGQLASGAVVSVVPRQAPVPWREVDLAAQPEPDQAAAVARLAEEDLAAGFDLARPPLLRATLAHLGRGRAQLVVTSHHALMDGWSSPMFFDELTRVYDAGGDASGLEPAPPFRDYLVWLAGQDPATGLAAWREALAGLDGPTLVAPGLPPGPAPRLLEVELPEAVTVGLTDAVRRRHLTVNSVVQAAWAAVVGLATGRDDVVFGATVAGRPPEIDGIESMIGLFINTVPVRVPLRLDEPLLDTAVRVQADQARLLNHHHLGLSTIIREAAGADELFDTLVAFENFPDLDDGDDDGGGLTLDEVDAQDVTHYPLTLIVTPGETITVGLRYRADHWAEAEARAILDRVVRLLTAAVAEPDVPLSRVDLLRAEERRRVLRDWNATGPLTPEVTFPAVFEAHAAATPDAVAVVFENEQLTYRELNERANRLARLLVAAGAGPESLVAVALPRSLDLITALVAVLKSGAAYLALDPDYPPDRLRMMLGDAAPVVAVSSHAVPTTARPRPAILLDDPATVDRLAARPAHDLTDDERRAPLRPAHAAYVIYTSGSTGRPKGVVVPHAGVAKLIATQTDRLRITGGSRVLQFASPSFDLAFWELVQAFGSGACLVVVPADRRVAGRELTDYLAEHGVTHLALPPSVLTMLPDDADLPDGATLLCGTEAVPPEVVARFSAGRRMFNAYGPTEATVNSTLWECPPGHRGPVPIGHPDPQMTAYVLDGALRPCPPGAPGELYIGGAGLARGYLRQPGLTATRFVADPYGPPGARLYRTGDRARWNADGAIEFLGRVDDQVKIRGFRVEPGEVEAVLESHPEVARAVVVAHDDGEGLRRLVGYVTAAPAATRIDPASLRTFVAERLPGYMVPAAIVVLDSFPVTPNNKVDRAALPAPDFAALTTAREPVTAEEQALAALFAEVLGIERVGADDDFFALGGHSLLATRLVTRLRTALGVEVPLRDVFEAPTVAGLATRLPGAGTARPALARRPRPDRLPLAPVQRGLWAQYRLEGPSPTYNIATAVRFRGELDHDALWHALGDLVERHEPLRTAFPCDEHGPYQQLLPATPPLLRVEPCRPDQVDDRLARLAARPFDLAREAPFEAHVLRVGDREHVVSLVVHHIASDGWSEATLIDDLITGYEARKAGRVPAWDPLPVSYADYTLWHEELLEGGLAADQLAYWRQALAGLPEETPLPADRPRPAWPDYRGGSVDLDIPPGLHRRLRDLAAAHGATMFMVTVAGLAALLHRHGAGGDIPVGTQVAGRSDEALDDLVGFFVNTLVVRADTSGDPTFAELLDRIRDRSLAALAHAELPFERLVADLDPPRPAARNPLFQVMLTYHNIPDPEPHVDDGSAEAEVVVTGVDSAWFDLMIDLNESSGRDGVNGTLRYQKARFRKATARRLAAGLIAILDAAADVPGRRLSELAGPAL
ncbi:MAG: amino acid adenylation domain-containing protein [Actinomycetota bacterium]